MIIVKGLKTDISGLTEAVPILFCFKTGAYFYVESDIIENELWTMKNWQMAERPSDKSWTILWQQGTQIPQELGDYLVTHQDNNQTPDSSEQTED